MAGQRTVAAPFLTKTYELVDDRRTDEVISWSPSGTTFVVWKTAEFAKDLLPNYFKHNNFSSFVRQLNTYGFRKIVPDKWEFANDNFKRGHEELLVDIRRRKSAAAVPTPTSPTMTSDKSKNPSSASMSAEDPASTSASSLSSKGVAENSKVVRYADLSEENERLKRDNEILSSELALTKRQCDELITILSRCVNVAPDAISHAIGEGSFPVGRGGDVIHGAAEEDSGADGKDESLKLFGVYLKGNEKKRGRDDNKGSTGAPVKISKTVEVHRDVPWMKICSSRGETGGVFN